MESHEIKTELTRMAPPIGVSTVSIAGVSLSEWVLGATLVYTLIQIGWTIYRIVRHFKGGNK
jgi:hypothetical protein